MPNELIIAGETFVHNLQREMKRAIDPNLNRAGQRFAEFGNAIAAQDLTKPTTTLPKILQLRTPNGTDWTSTRAIDGQQLASECLSFPVNPKSGKTATRLTLPKRFLQDTQTALVILPGLYKLKNDVRKKGLEQLLNCEGNFYILKELLARNDFSLYDPNDWQLLNRIPHTVIANGVSSYEAFSIPTVRRWPIQQTENGPMYVMYHAEEKQMTTLERSFWTEEIARHARIYILDPGSTDKQQISKPLTNLIPAQEVHR